MGIKELVKTEILLLSEKYMAESEDKYSFWDEHIKYAVLEALVLAEKYNADTEIVELAAMLHDVALIARNGTREEHHITGAEMAETILKKHNYPQYKIDKVKKCVLNHRSGKNGTDIEEICVADADTLSHFDNVPMLFNVIMNDVWSKNNVTNIPELKSRMKESFENDYNDLSERTKQAFCDRYKLICQIVLGL